VGGFSSYGSSQFVNNGLTSFNGLAPGAGDVLPEIELQTNELGYFDETITVYPTDSNNTGYNAALTPVTIDVMGTVTAPPAPPPPAVPTADVWGVGHFVTFDGLYYNFDAAGEFVLTKSTVGGDTFQVQARLQPYDDSPASSVQT
jgi:von Willebrand factor type D domain